MVEAHGSRYSIHPDATKMYRDLQEFKLCDGLKRDIAEFVSRCYICQKVKDEHQKSGALTLVIMFLLGSGKTITWTLLWVCLDTNAK